jgi:hypothetical protein
MPPRLALILAPWNLKRAFEVMAICQSENAGGVAKSIP